ncbi:MAG: hypothetical protein UY21_C0001G0096 [Microgenomates group bacterium GW2011_GWA1_48_10]|nr:MAG: hypothetical protein UY21_C0001G0096 [Microgenomates group bacterium GW2011_GWA1_48_10]
MTQLKKQITGALTIGLMVAQLLAPVAAYAEDGINLTISGNGAQSTSVENVAVVNTTTVSQTNTSNVTNNVDSKSNSGGNDANYNTGGDVAVITGKATSNVDVLNDLNKNIATVDCCEPASTTVTIDGNGYQTKNDVNLSQTNTNALVQTNVANVLNNVDSKANSGWNDAKYNTGGDTTIITGDAEAGAEVATHANTNVGMIGEPLVGGNNGGVSLWITGNGANSDNSIALALAKANTIAQTNVANITNDVYAKANSGGNDANGNTGGDVAIITGKADAMVGVDNDVNFNWADVDCGCITNVEGKIAGNGYMSKNDINASLTSYLYDAQLNTANLLNDVDAKAKSGYNDANYNTGPVLDDPVVIMTGAASSSTEVANSTNTNVYGQGVFPLPPMPEVDWDFDLGWSWFLGWMHS